MPDLVAVQIDLNADVGEGFDDAPLFPYLSSINVACGGHAGDEATMRETLERAAAGDLSVGAHPSFPDREGFGRRITTRDAGEIRALVRTQTKQLAGYAEEYAVRLSHVKPHGALYNLSAQDRAIADAVAAGVRDVDPAYTLVGLAGSVSIRAAHAAELPTLAEAFVDRGYLDDGTLAPRDQPGAVLGSPEAAAARALALARQQPIESVSGRVLRVSAQTLCLHGDTAGALAMVRAVHAGLVAAGVEIRRPNVSSGERPRGSR